ncbi:MAG TPA: carboxypeptidase regulatory-like domain-containing protein [Terriglobales bacterium]
MVSLGLLVLAVTASLAEQTAPALPRPADLGISGTLVDSVSGQPLARARVAIAPVSERDNLTTVITGQDGNFSFSGLMPGKYTLTAQARGYLTQSFDQHDRFASSIVVGPDLVSTGLLFRLPPEGLIVGVVTDEAGEAVRNAMVALYYTGLSGGVEATRSRGSASTDDDGRYHFGHLVPGRYLVAINARPWYARYTPRYAPNARVSVSGASASITNDQDGLSASTHAVASPPSQDTGNTQLDVAYPVTFYGGETDASKAMPIVLAAGDRVQADVTLQPVHALHLRLSGGQGESGLQPWVMLEKSVLDGPPVFVMTGGGQEIVGVAPGRYLMKTYGNGSDANGNESREVDLTAVGELDRSLGNPYAQITAKVEVDPSALSPQASMQLLNKKTRETVVGRLGSDGEVVFKNGVPPGSYEVSISTTAGIYLKSLMATGTAVSGRTIEVRSGGNIKMLVTTARGQARITGTAQRDGKPVAGVMIVLVPADPAHNEVLFRRDQSDSDGTFTLASVVPGKYTLLAIEKGWELEWMNPDVLRSYLGRGVAVEVRENDKYDIKVPVQ